MICDFREKRDEKIEAILLENGFESYPLSEGSSYYYLACSWTTDDDYCGINVEPHDYGYYVDIRSHACGANHMVRVGSSNCAYHILSLRDVLKHMF